MAELQIWIWPTLLAALVVGVLVLIWRGLTAGHKHARDSKLPGFGSARGEFKTSPTRMEQLIDARKHLVRQLEVLRGGPHYNAYVATNVDNTNLIAELSAVLAEVEAELSEHNGA